MDKNQFWELYNELQPGQRIELYFGGDVKKSWDVNGSKPGYTKKKKVYIGRIELFPELPGRFRAKTKSFATPRSKGKKRFYNFGVLLPKRIKKTEENSKVIQWAKTFTLLRSMEFKVKESTWTDTFMRLEYQVKEIEGIKVYYYEGNPRYIEFKGRKLSIPTFRDTLNTEYFSTIDEVK